MASLLQLYKGSGAAGGLLVFMLGPSVVSLGMQMYKQRAPMFSQGRAVIAATLGASVLGLFGTAALARVLQLGEALRLATVSRQLTSPLAMACAGMLETDVPLAVSMVVITGLLGANFGAAVMTKFGISSPVTRGLAMGTSAHGLGTGALAASEPEAFAFSAIAMALTGTISTIIVSFSPLREILIKYAGL